MVLQIVTPDTSIAVSGAAGIASADTTNSILVLAGAHVTSTDFEGISLTNNQASQFTIDGTVASADDEAILVRTLQASSNIAIKVGVSGLIAGGIGMTAIDIEATGSLIENHGTITGEAALVLNSENNEVVNTGTITGKNFAITFANNIGSSELFNSGIISSDLTAISGSETIETIVNTGTIVGDVALAGGNDAFSNLGGVVHGTVDLGNGDDTFTGGASDEKVLGGDGIDTVRLKGGDDTFVASGGDDDNDVLRGGDGSDTYDATGVSTQVFIDLDQGIATGLGIDVDIVLNFENVIGSESGNDTITGTGGINRLEGRAGGDTLIGLAGDDELEGGSGNDTLTGGLGKDDLTGGLSEGDVFDFNSAAESGITAATRDLIVDFESSLDLIDLTTIDANTKKKGNQDFAFIDAENFHKVAGELHYRVTNNGTILEGDLNGDKKADFSIMLAGVIGVVEADLLGLV